MLDVSDCVNPMNNHEKIGAAFLEAHGLRFEGKKCGGDASFRPQGVENSAINRRMDEMAVLIGSSGKSFFVHIAPQMQLVESRDE